jgi:hypothetical protein
MKPREFKPEELEIVGTYPNGAPMVKTCVHLRCKSMYYSGLERPGVVHLSEAMTYWCNHTQEAAGCDRGDAHPLTCQKGRACCDF